MINEIDLSEGWILMELKDICLKKAEYGSGAKAIDFEYKKPRYVRITDIDDNGNLKKTNIVSPDLVEEKYFLEENDLLFARSGSVGKTYLYKKSDGLCQFAGYLIRFKPNPTIIDSDYLNYVVKSLHYWNWVESKKKTMTISNINAKQYSGLKIPVPPLETQKKIVEILEKAEKLKEWRAEADELVDDYLESVFLEMFGNLGSNDKNWEIVDFGDLISLLTDYHANGSYKILKEHVTLYDQPNYALMVRTTDLEKNNFVDDVKYIDESAYNFLRKSKVFGGELLINKIGSAGNVYLMPELNRPVSLAMNQFMIRLNEKANNIFIYYLLTSDYGDKIIKSKVKGAVTKTITKDAVRSLKLPIPPITLQNQFAQIVQQVETLKTHQAQSKQEIDNLFNTLMQKAFKGELVC